MELNCILRTYGAKGEGKSSEMVIQLCVPLVLLKPEDHVELSRLKMENAVKAVIKPLQLMFAEDGEANPDLPNGLFSQTVGEAPDGEPEAESDVTEQDGQDALIKTVMHRDQCSYEEAVEHIEGLAAAVEDPEPESLAVVGKIVKHTGGMTIYRIDKVRSDSVILNPVDPAGGPLRNITPKQLETQYVETELPVLTQV